MNKFCYEEYADQLGLQSRLGLYSRVRVRVRVRTYE